MELTVILISSVTAPVDYSRGSKILSPREVVWNFIFMVKTTSDPLDSHVISILLIILDTTKKEEIISSSNWNYCHNK